ncbi:hypothetical protein BPY_04110 [Bifidobacterium psychraerophilum]
MYGHGETAIRKPGMDDDSKYRGGEWPRRREKKGKPGPDNSMQAVSPWNGWKGMEFAGNYVAKI